MKKFLILSAAVFGVVGMVKALDSMLTFITEFDDDNWDFYVSDF